VAHILKQPPQFLVSMLVSTQVPEQLVWPLGHCAVHWPFWHVRFAAHCWPQLPQLVASDCVLMHVPLQQSLPEGQACPHEPQLRGSAFVFTQVPAQLT